KSEAIRMRRVSYDSDHEVAAMKTSSIALCILVVAACDSRGAGDGGPDASVDATTGHEGGGPRDMGVAPTDMPVIPPGDAGPGDVQLTISSAMRPRPISPYIYGSNGPDWTRGGVTLTRSGGNRLTAYDWENNASNAGSDYMFQNDDYLCSGAG